MSRVSASSFSFSWSPWDEMDDGGDGPIAGYVINLKIAEDKEWHDVGYVPATTPSSMSSSSTLQYFTVTCLKKATLYHATVSVLHGGTGQAGNGSPILTIKTSGNSNSMLCGGTSVNL